MKKQAKTWACSGIVLRASGVKWDLRREMPYGLYPELDFDVPIASTGDCYGRYKCHMKEMGENYKDFKTINYNV